MTALPANVGAILCRLGRYEDTVPGFEVLEFPAGAEFYDPRIDPALTTKTGEVRDVELSWQQALLRGSVWVHVLPPWCGEFCDNFRHRLLLLMRHTHRVIKLKLTRFTFVAHIHS